MKKALAILLTTVLALSLFSGCKGNGSTKTSKVSVQTGLSGKVVMYHYMQQQGKQNGLNDLIKAFQKINPKVQIETNYVVQTNYFSTVRQLVASGDAPDIIMGQPSQYPDIINTGIIRDLSNESDVKALGLSKDDISDSSYNGKLYAFPFDFKTYGVFYNKSIYSKLSLQVPKTHAELIENCKKIKAAGIDPFIRCYNDQVYPDIEMRAYFWPALIADGKQDAWAKLMAGTTKFSDYPEWKEALTLWTDRLQFSRIDDMSNDQTKGCDLFAGGKGAMFYDGSWNIGEYLSRNPSFDIGIFPMPTDKGPGTFCEQVDDLFMVNGQSSGGKIAYEFMKSCLQPANALIWCKDSTEPSLVPGVDTSNLPSYLKDIVAAKSKNQVASAGEFTQQIYGEFTTKYRASLQAYAADQLSTKKLNVDTFTAQLQTTWNAVVAKTATSK